MRSSFAYFAEQPGPAALESPSSFILKATQTLLNRRERAESGISRSHSTSAPSAQLPSKPFNVSAKITRPPPRDNDESGELLLSAP
eukprot:CAMPEP_0185774938 /NCGR_PEP_ID=MMETSP1174-20130828/80503_1 /TAXON_ID=35687 /ORGANISM="Dictyocha speculum, Strain CCMP1381" /LENGTH=85 /DNA_ID=CAMNT_0028462345 /DNA_START=193 /DNA_END=450 /DNA_ORIENTATION=+